MEKIKYELDSSVGYLIFLINQRMHAFFRKKLSQEGVNMVETWVLLQILNGIETSHELNRVLKVDMVQLQRACDSLVAKNYVVRSLDSDDRRVKILSLTKSGEELIKKLIKHSKLTNENALGSLKKNERDDLKRLLIKVLDNPFFNIKE